MSTLKRSVITKFPAFTDEYGSGATNARKLLTELFYVRYSSIIINVVL